MAKILVIDDEEIIRERLKKLLEIDGYKTFIAEDGPRGLEIFQKERPEIVLIDIKMPGMDGIEVLKKIRSISKETENIIITGHGGIETAIQALKEGAFSYITKPIEYDELEIDIKKALEKQEMQEKLDEYVQHLEEMVEKRTRALRETQAQLIQSGKMAAIGQFAAGVAHEIRNPLTGVTMNTAFLLDELKDNDKAVTRLRRIEKETDRASNIVKSLLTFSSPSKEEMVAADINHLIDETLVLREHQISLANVEIIRQFNSNLPKVNVEPSEISQVLLNLINNAVEAMNEGGKLFIKTYIEKVTKKGKRQSDVFKLEQDIVCVEFNDTGKGISEDGLGKLFTPFHTTKDPGKGVGLGLFISHGIVERHKGEIEVKSEIGKGTIFTVKLPVG